jgi:AmiR/NasT family two-component response regulator
MMRDRINREQAFEVLRSNARSRRRPIADVANELLASAESLYTVKKARDPARPRKR